MECSGKMLKGVLSVSSIVTHLSTLVSELNHPTVQNIIQPEFLKRFNNLKENAACKRCWPLLSLAILLM
jgi:hypothetical protein